VTSKAVLAGACLVCWNACAAPFVNLDFQGAFPDGVFDENEDPTPAEAIPGWTPRVGEEPLPIVLVNSILIGSTGVVLFDMNYHQPGGPQYHLVLYSGYAAPMPLASISQTGDVPPDARRVQMYCQHSAGPVVTLDGVNIPMINLGNWQWAGDVSTFAGQTASLRITTPRTGYQPTHIDDIQFSSAVIPEPATATFAAMSLGLLVRRCRHQH
jgi:hypothetical protein